MTKTTFAGCDDASVLNVNSLKTLIENHSNPADDIQEYVSASKAEQYKHLIRTIQNHAFYEQGDVHVEPTNTLHHSCPVYFSDVEKLFRHCSFTVCAYCEHSCKHAQITNIKSFTKPAQKVNASPKAFVTSPLLAWHRIDKTKDLQVPRNTASVNITTIDPTVPYLGERNDAIAGSGARAIHKEPEDRVVNIGLQIVKPDLLHSLHGITEGASSRRSVTDSLEERTVTKLASLVLDKITPSVSIPAPEHSDDKPSPKVIETSDFSNAAESDAIHVSEEIVEYFVDISPQIVELDSPYLLPVPEITESTISLVPNETTAAVIIPGESVHSDAKPSHKVIEMSHFSNVTGIDTLHDGIDECVVDSSSQVVEPNSPHLLPLSNITESTVLRSPIKESSKENSVTKKVSVVVNKVTPTVNIAKETACSDVKTIQDVIETPDCFIAAITEIIPEKIDESVMYTNPGVVKHHLPDSLPKATEIAPPRSAISEPRTVTETISPDLNKISPSVSISAEFACTDIIPSHKIIENFDDFTVVESAGNVILEEADECIADKSHRVTTPSLPISLPNIAETTPSRSSMTDSFEERNVTEPVPLVRNKLGHAISLSEETEDSDAEPDQEVMEISDHSALSDTLSEDSESDPEFLFSPLTPLHSRVGLKETHTSALSSKYASSSVQRYMDQLLEEHNKEEHLKKLVSDHALGLSTSLAEKEELMFPKDPLNRPNRIRLDPPGLQIFDMSRMCHFFNSSCISFTHKILPTGTSSPFEKKLLSIPTDILLHAIESKGLESCAISHLSESTKHALLNFLWRIMSVSEKYLTVASCQRLINYIVCELKNKWSPSLVDVAAILINLGATENGCPLKDLLKSASQHLDKEFPFKAFTKPTKPENIFQNLRRLLQTLTSFIGQSNYSSVESAHFVLLMCWISLDHKLNNYGFKPEIQSCIKEGLDKIADEDWPEELEYLCKELVLLQKDHHNLSWMATFFPPSTRGLQLQRSFCFTAMQILIPVDEEPVFCFQVSPQDVLQFLHHRKIDSNLDKHLLYNFFQLLNMSISLRILQQDEKAIKELAASIMETFSFLRDNPYDVETTYVKTLLVGIRTKWMGLLNATAIKKAFCPDSESSLSSDSS